MFVSFSSSLPLSLFLSHTLHVYVCMCVCISVFKNRVIKSPSFSHLYICLLTHSYSVYMLICYTFWSIDWMMMDRICISKWYEFSKLHQKKNHTSYFAVVWVLKMVGLISFFSSFFWHDTWTLKTVCLSIISADICIQSGFMRMISFLWTAMITWLITFSPSNVIMVSRSSDCVRVCVFVCMEYAKNLTQFCVTYHVVSFRFLLRSISTLSHYQRLSVLLQYCFQFKSIFNVYLYTAIPIHVI